MNKKLFFSLLIAIAMAASLVGIVSADGCQTVDYAFDTYDNGMGGPWAVDHFKSKVTICPVEEGVYSVAYIDDQSTFVTIDGNSPGGGGPLIGGITGIIDGGITRIIEGDLKDDIPSVIGPIDFTDDPAPRQYESPFFEGPYTVLDVTTWGWHYSVGCSDEVWHDNDAAEALYGLVGPNALMGDITKKGNCPPPPEKPGKTCAWARDVINSNHKYKDEAQRFMKNHPTCQFTSKGYYWYWAAHPELLK